MSQALAFRCWLMLLYCSPQKVIRKRVSASDQLGERLGFRGIAAILELTVCAMGRSSEERLVTLMNRDSTGDSRGAVTELTLDAPLSRVRTSRLKSNG